MSGRDEVDTVIVGAGAAGCVLAARLSERGSRSVLLLEAGPDLGSDLPAGIRDGWRMTQDFDWGFVSEPDVEGRTEPLRRGKVVGGTSSVTRFAVRGAPGDYDEWAALGNAGWAFHDVLPDFRALETDNDFGDEPWHGDRGPIPVNRYPDLERTAIHATLARSFEDAGFPAVADHNRPGSVGAGPMPMSSRDGVRATTASGYLADVRRRPNLAIRGEATVSTILLDGMKAIGVRLADGTEIRANRVVLSAGTYGSPPILMRSGIGPAEDLRSLGIPVRVDLAGVGANLGDHPAVDVDPGFRGRGRDVPILHTIATFHSSFVAQEGPPDLMLWTSDPRGADAVVSIDVVLLKPRSRGSVRLRSADPLDPPRIDLPNLQDPVDVERLVEGLARGLDVASRPGVRAAGGEPPQPADQTRDALRRYVRENGYSVPHVVGTCAMGPSPDAGAVVDPSLRVHGTEGLYVVDASVMPTVPSGFTHLPTIMLAERFARLDAARA